ncbi:MAG: rRNA maturation RNase YbeY [Spirochaetes bacterium RBG_16_49_21]|nr:MAG: rRNA maturation RNase YbeY [Spirochaetes bacterium RBG_16_49_21]
MVRIEVFGEGVRFPCRGISRKKIREIAAAAAGFLELDNSLVTVVIADDAYIRAINSRYRGHDTPTDVLSFPGRETPFPRVTERREDIGEIYLSMDRAVGQADEYRVLPIDEIKRLIVHGMLHLVGYDHERSRRDKVEMERKEEEILRKMTSSPPVPPSPQ